MSCSGTDLYIHGNGARIRRFFKSPVTIIRSLTSSMGAIESVSDVENVDEVELSRQNKHEEIVEDQMLLNTRQLEFELMLQQIDFNCMEQGPTFEYDSHSMLFFTSNLECNIKQSLSRYNGQYCFVCGQEGGPTIGCCVERCLSRYHRDCIDPQLMGEYHPYLNSTKVACPRHHCTICFSENNRTTAFQNISEEKLYYCIYCTSAYHQVCFPAGCPRKGNRIICNQHIRRRMSNCPGLPYCFGCRKMFDDSTQDPKETCQTCPRSFHSSCARVNMRRDNTCFYCVNKWSPRKGQLCHVFVDKKFYPAQVATMDYKSAVNLRGEVPVFLFSNYTRSLADLRMVPRCHIAPMISYEPTAIYNENHPDYGIFKEKYENTVAQLPLFKLFPNRSTRLPKFLQNMKNRIPSHLKPQMYQQVDYEVCNCKVVDGFKCVDDTCVNRYSGNECGEGCGEGCINGREARKVTNAVEIVSVPFGGYGLQAKETILEGHPIGEYTGTIIDKDKTNELLTKHELQRNQEAPLYIMHIVGSLHINSNPIGNSVRYANHSCNPNSVITLITGVDEMPHQMLIAKRQINAGEQITFDYGHTWSKFNPRCYCGSEACSAHLSRKLLKRVMLKDKKSRCELISNEVDPSNNKSKKRKNVS